MKIIFILNYFCLLIFLLVSVAFYTLLERKFLGYCQLRRGPNKVSVLGLLQPMADGLKLFLKEDIFPYASNKVIYFLSPIFGMTMMFISCNLYPYMNLLASTKWSWLFFLVFSGLAVYPIILSGWSSTSKYANLGSYRAIAQTISYEINMSMIILAFVLFHNNFSCSSFKFYSWSYYIVYMMFIFIWLSVILAETHRSPYDLPEGESELVSGFNVDYAGGGFALIFIAEYGQIIIMSMITSYLFTSWSLTFGFFIMFLFLWVRSTFPRFRYDYLMYMSWKMYLPLVVGSFNLVLSLFFLSL